LTGIHLLGSEPTENVVLYSAKVLLLTVTVWPFAKQPMNVTVLLRLDMGKVIKGGLVKELTGIKRIKEERLKRKCKARK
jgi:hypothetical protein